MQKERKTLTEQLEPMAWRVTQREAQKGYEHADTIEKWGDIIAAVMDFQNRWEGHSPSNQCIAKMTNLSPGQVGYHLKRMEERGLIADDGQWPRHITIYAAKVQNVQEKLPLQTEWPIKEEVKTVTTTRAKAHRQNFLDRAKEFAQHLQDSYDQTGQAPYLGEVAVKMGYRVEGQRESGKRGGTGGLSRVVQQMVERGWLYHKPKHQRDMRLTGLGRAILFGVNDEEVHTDMPVRPPQVAQQPEPAPVPMATAFPARVEVRRAEPVPAPIDYRAPVAQPTAPPAPVPVTPPDLKGVDTVDLLLELQSRGLKVSR